MNDASPHMGGTQRQPDPSELDQDRARRWWMNLAVVVLAAGCAMSGGGVGQRRGLVAVLPLGVAIKLVEMRASACGISAP